MMRTILYILLIILIIPLDSLAKESSPYTYEFLKLGGGARALGMGGAFVAIADDATAGYWNPAGLALLEKREVSGETNKIGNPAFGIKHDYIAMGIPVAELPGFLEWLKQLDKKIGKCSGGFGFSYIGLGVDDIKRTNADNYGDIVRLGVFEDKETGVIFSYGKEIFSDLLWVGGSGKYINHKLDTSKGTGWGLDFGTLNNLTSLLRWRWLPENTKLGTIFHCYGRKKWGGYEDYGVISGELGLSTRLSFREKSKLLLGLSLERGKEYPLIASIGGESQWLVDMGLVKEIDIRAGIDNWYLGGSGNRNVSCENLNYARKFSFGLGIKGDKYQVDWVIFPHFGRYLNEFNRFDTDSQVSLTGRF